MSNLVFLKISVLIRKWLAKKVAEINQPAVIKGIYTEVEVTAGYFVTLTLANLIALSGLINNSASVIIGAMLISPLMGPILGFGFAFITAEKTLLKKAVRKIAVSVVLTIVVALIAVFLSPLKEITGEILSRTKPNIFDLAIAVFSGTAGAVAICTKKNYMTIVPGVAIATAVIPPLSVTGFGLGIGNWGIAFGGFFLFFTNFVAIVIATCAVFYFYGFRPSTVNEADIANLKKRIILLAGVLFVISIPLIYTLHRSITEITLHKKIAGLLKQELDREKISRLQTFSYLEKDEGIEINAVVNTVEYLPDEALEDIEKDMSSSLVGKVKLNIDQVKVQPRGLKESVVAPAAPPRPPSEVLKSSREDLLRVMRKTAGRVEKLISPSPVVDVEVGFSDKTEAVGIGLTILRDAPLSGEQVLLLKRLIAEDLGLPVKLTIANRPFVEPLIFQPGETAMPPALKTHLAAVGDAFRKDGGLTVLIESYPDRTGPYKKRMALAAARAEGVAGLLGKEYGLPPASIVTSVIKVNPGKEPVVKVSTVIGKMN